MTGLVDPEACFPTHFSAFSQGMMEKLRIEEMEIPSEIGRFKMYGEMALYPRVDSKTFVRVARAHDLCRYVSPSILDMRSCMPNQILDQLITR